MKVFSYGWSWKFVSLQVFGTGMLVMEIVCLEFCIATDARTWLMIINIDITVVTSREFIYFNIQNIYHIFYPVGYKLAFCRGKKKLPFTVLTDSP